VIDADALPIHPAARAHFETRGDDALLRALTAGDDYELLFAVRPRTRRRLAEAGRNGGVPITRIGQCTDDRAVLLRRGGVVTPVPEGYSHFARLQGSRAVDPTGSRSIDPNGSRSDA
jgi:thiamine-monophosphate kinase